MKKINSHRSTPRHSAQPLRIIGGEFKRRQIEFAALDGLRPTPDRVRETLFNWLMWDITGAIVLDVCTGSGALAFEALSRGASHVTMIEPQNEQIQFLRQNINTLKQEDKVQLYHDTAQNVLKRLSDVKFDLVLLDPPYSLNLWQELAELLSPFLHENSLIYVEANQDLSQIKLPSHWQLKKNSKAGQVYFGLFQTL
ncbi:MULTISPECIES: 16S rRNA (guanine(966)-N(2))-methyltransferase RsmD [unclassified Acinetobacter]|uniref:16S rRNA (guanine(966)-N(2))-methyltransferase RsmD n=1 Tax=unclassified Acinetobacter TaxID=196816 RepID=UPI0035B9ACCB